MEEVIARMRRYAADLFDNSDTSYQLVLDDAVGGKKLKMEQRRDVYLIYKESLNNIYKHAGAEKVLIKVATNHRSFELMIRDNGKGFNIDQPTHRNGLKNLQERVKKWNGKLSIRSARDEGTTIIISIPVGA
jgi:signal transduction histidine kinase